MVTLAARDCPFRVNRVVSAMSAVSPLYRHERTSSVRPTTVGKVPVSGHCHITLTAHEDAMRKLEQRGVNPLGLHPRSQQHDPTHPRGILLQVYRLESLLDHRQHD